MAQEAQGAAKSLRDEVKVLRQSLAPPAERTKRDSERVSSLPGERSLNALDQAISLLGTLQGNDNTRPRRRGRVDIAALLYELVPDWRINIAPGAGTEVYGDQQDFRRIFQVLIAQSQGPSGDTPAAGGGQRVIEVKRENEWVRISVELGPDAAASNDLDRSWLSRMTLRYGGRLELQGKTQSLLLPAESSSQQELKELKRELAQAQLLGETYARELASVFSEDSGDVAPSETPHEASQERQRAEWTLNTLRSIARSGLLAREHSVVPSARSRDESGLSVVPPSGVLPALCETDPNETAVTCDLAEVLSRAIRYCESMAKRQEVSVELAEQSIITARLSARPTTLRLLVHSLLQHAISASPRGANTIVCLTEEGSDLVLTTEDAGPNVPASQVSALLEQRLDPATLGRPKTPELTVAHCLAITQNARLDITTGGELRTLTRVRFDKRQ